jgi:hypothetical protein
MIDDERSIHFNKLPNKTYVSKRLPYERGRSFRIASKVFDSREGQHFAFDRGELVIRVTSNRRQEIIAKFTEDDRQIFRLTLQRWLTDTGNPYTNASFSFGQEEIDRLLEFLLNIKRMHFPNSEKVNITDEELQRLILSSDQARRLIIDNEDLVLSIARNDITTRDIVAIGYRKEQLRRFDKLLSDKDYFASEEAKLKKTAEGVWQAFFEQNKWIFGYGLSYVSLSALDNAKLEQVVAGANFMTAGKRADALMKTRAVVSSLCFVEIKTHLTALVSANPYRSGAWQASSDLTGGVAQVQTTVDKAVKVLGNRLHVADRDGQPTGEEIFNADPRSFLVIGHLGQFQTANGINEAKWRSFELFRRNVRLPEIITFDELFHRAKFIVEHEAN